MNVNEEIKKIFKDATKSSRATLTRDINVFYEDGRLTLSLKKEALYSNMQEDKAAFEAWALIIRALWHEDKKEWCAVSIDVPELKELPNPRKVFIGKEMDKRLAGHYGRFLYRADKFSEEFDWFELPEKIQDCVNEYRNLLNEFTCTNIPPENEPSDEPSNKTIDETNASENDVERLFGNNSDELKILSGGKINGAVYRQLPCRLRSNNRKYHFLTKGPKSAMDLWNLSDNTLNILELKLVTKDEDGNETGKQVGIISELFFYVEYCKDMFVEPPKTFKLSPAPKKVIGYNILFNAQKKEQIRDVRGFFLTNEYHPLMRDKAGEKVKKVLNDNKSGIEFIMLPEYNLDHMLSLQKESVQS